MTPQLLQLGSVNLGASTLQPALTDQALAPVVKEAKGLWAAAGGDISKLSGVRFEVANLPGQELGLTTNGLIQIDVNAAGQGWYVSPHPGQQLRVQLEAVQLARGGDAESAARPSGMSTS